MEETVLLSLASDLKRISQAIQRNSSSNILRFSHEAKECLKVAQKVNTNSSVFKLLKAIAEVLKKRDDLIKAEDCLMYSVLLQNRAISSK